MNCLPGRFEDVDVKDLIRAVSALTVRVSVKCVSEKRVSVKRVSEKLPEISADGEKFDRCYSESTSNMMITGTGYVRWVSSKTMEICSCKECHMSLTPNTEFAHIYVQTAAQVVCDEFEGHHSTCDFFFDRGRTPDTCSGVITLSEVSRVDCTKEDSRLIFVTHDLSLADKLRQNLILCESLEKRLVSRYKPSPRPYRRRTPAKGDTGQLVTVIVSHPHGCSKHVSVGQCTRRFMKCRYSSQLTYTTATCSGSAGARVLVLGGDRWGHTHVHLGQCELNKENNHSGYGTEVRLRLEEL